MDVSSVACPIIIDVEASGFGSRSYPIEVGVVSGDGSRYCSLVQPAPDWTHWNVDAEKLHGVSREMLETCGKPIIKVTSDLNRMLSGKTIYSDGWVVDKPWLITLFDVAKMSMNFHVSPLEMILSEYQMEHWKETRGNVIKEAGMRRHRASNDAWIIQRTFVETLNQTCSDNAQVLCSR